MHKRARVHNDFKSEHLLLKRKVVAWTTDEQKNNLTYIQKHLLKWYCRIGHLGLQHIQWIVRKLWLGKFSTKFDRTTIIPTRCASYLYGKQDINPKKGATLRKYKNR